MQASGKSHNASIPMEGPHGGQNVCDPNKYAHTVSPRKILMPMRDLSMVAILLILYLTICQKTIHFGTWNFSGIFWFAEGNFADSKREFSAFLLYLLYYVTTNIRCVEHSL